MTETTRNPADNPEQKRQGIPLPAWLGRPGAVYLIRLAVTALVVWITLAFVIGVHLCHSQAGSPMIRDGDLCVTYRLSAPARGDVAVYRHGGEVFFGRVFGLANEKVTITAAAVMVDGFGIPDSDGYQTGQPEGQAFVCTVPQDCVFVLNDCRTDLSDSRTWGAIPLKDCEGSVIFLMRHRGF